jgi:hypothetical protein
MEVKKWFNEIVGYEEKKWNYELESLPKVIIDNMGEFNTFSIKELKEKKYKKTKQKKLIVYLRKEKNKENDYLFDTSVLQFNTKKKTLFQVASNFNCHELASSFQNPFSGKYITNLMSDITQGPSACGGAIFGSFLRLSQHKIKEINLLEDTTLKPNNGKLYNKKIDIFDFDIDNIKIGLHTDVRATFCRSEYIFAYNPKGPLIDQIYTSTCIFTNKYDKNYNLASLLLYKAYEGTYLSAIIRKSEKIVLTLIGGGAFENPLHLIVDNIMNIHNAYSEFLIDNCEIILPIYEPNKIDVHKLFIKYPNVEIIWID